MQLVLSRDVSCYLDWIPGETPMAAMPNWRCRHISEDVLPALREAGVSDADIDTMLVDAPLRSLTPTSPY